MKLDLTALKKFCDGELTVSELHVTAGRSKHTREHTNLDRAFVAIAIMLWAKDRDGEPICGEDGSLKYTIVEIMTAIYPSKPGGAKATSVALNISSYRLLHSAGGRPSKLRLPEEVTAVLESYGGVPPGVQSFLEENGPLNLP